MIRAEQLVHTYGATTALAGISFEIPVGQIVGLVGPNGAGKTTAMKILTGYIAPASGKASIGDHDIVTDRLAAQRLLGYLPENAPVWRDMLVQDYLLLIAKLRNVLATERQKRFSEVVRACDLASVRTKPIAHLSKGFRQRVGLAQAMIHDPQVLILDEPTSGLDPTQIMEIREVIRRMGQKKTVILSTHILSEVESTCDRALMIVGGKIHVDENMDSFRRGKGLRVRALNAPAGTRAKLAHVPGVLSVDEEAQPDGTTVYRLTTAPGADVAVAVAEAARDAGVLLTELAREQHDLEDIFRSLKAQDGRAA
ncbi:MAG: ATP-binding cassette domain-containing protein [Planctomycetes bacterium]|nr:ATP-binding cassette domain-containing protein [Planctomycetota bacterium]